VKKICHYSWGPIRGEAVDRFCKIEAKIAISKTYGLKLRELNFDIFVSSYCNESFADAETLL